MTKKNSLANSLDTPEMVDFFQTSFSNFSKACFIFSKINRYSGNSFPVKIKNTARLELFSSREAFKECLFVRQHSLMSLLILFLCTALLKCFVPTVKPACKAGCSLDSSRYTTLNGKTENAFPSLKSFWIIFRLFNRSFACKVFFS